jgi:hypothetical protein
MRRCTFCGVIKPLDDFYGDGPGKKRLDCKTCYNIRRKENRNTKRHSDFIGGQKRRSDAEITFSHQEWKECLIFFGGSCAYCGATTRRNKFMTKDHLIPVANGGKTVAGNIVPGCSCCNGSKGSKEWREWFMAQEFFSQDRMNRIFQWRTIMSIVGDDHG